MKFTHILFVIIFCFLFAALAVGSARNESVTYDEPLHMQEGIAALTRHTFDVDPLNPPLVRELAALPIVGETIVQAPSPLTPNIAFGRLVIITLSLCLLIAVFLVTKTYF